MVKTQRSSTKEILAEVTTDLHLTVTHDTSPAAATVTFTQMEPDDDYWYYQNVSGLTPNVSYDIQLRNAQGRKRSSFGGFADKNGEVINVKRGSSSLAEILNGGSYLVYEYDGYNLSADGKTLSYRVTTLGDWTTFGADSSQDG